MRRFPLKGTASRLGGGLRGARRASSQECTHHENGTLAAILELTIHSSLKNYVTKIQKARKAREEVSVAGLISKRDWEEEYRARPRLLGGGASRDGYSIIPSPRPLNQQACIADMHFPHPKQKPPRGD
ncbi:hypothetical protein CN878_18395 [Ochrobactrum sp. 695/2009]|nr:hypothetical protein CN881_09450 [Ochrobactrum sp. 721/2009]PJT14879.1 hypothetical protein CN880_16255 [Ochrobactrum sp. 720/2009]PJT20288.1 hypothetical protein CN879_18260 [Ochrobactrum sp. 715/2009]PJT28258.1 hypothetical protein CN878_18395 [Ochrobactrum sp. 695/2009]PJT34720.1 hypothetical protein CN877_01080 [Ochrobactrum sp. 689/2009]